MSGSMICAPAIEMPCSIGSNAEGTKLAEKPPETPANAAAMPANGMPSSGVEDETTEWNDQDIAGVNRGVTHDADEDHHRRQQPFCRHRHHRPQRGTLMNPDCSATPMPNMATNTTPTGAKRTNSCTMEAKKVVSALPDS